MSISVHLRLPRTSGSLPMWTEKALEVARCLLKEIITQFGILMSFGSDNGQPLWPKWYS
jgi:hypothetical protein